MKKIVRIFVCLLACYSQLQAEISPEVMEYIQNWRNTVIWLGAKCPDSPSKIDPKKIEEFEDRGLKICEESAYDGEPFAQAILAGYYFNYIEDYPKAIFWAKHAAENGSGPGMRILAVAYGTSKGVVFDEVEAIKWFILSSCFGDEISQEYISTYKNSAILSKAKVCAAEWIELHKDTLYKP